MEGLGCPAKIQHKLAISHGDLSVSFNPGYEMVGARFTGAALIYPACRILPLWRHHITSASHREGSILSYEAPKAWVENLKPEGNKSGNWQGFTQLPFQGTTNGILPKGSQGWHTEPLSQKQRVRAYRSLWLTSTNFGDIKLGTSPLIDLTCVPPDETISSLKENSSEEKIFFFLHFS